MINLTHCSQLALPIDRSNKCVFSKKFFLILESRLCCTEVNYMLFNKISSAKYDYMGQVYKHENVRDLCHNHLVNQ